MASPPSSDATQVNLPGENQTKATNPTLTMKAQLSFNTFGITACLDSSTRQSEQGVEILLENM